MTLLIMTLLIMTLLSMTILKMTLLIMTSTTWSSLWGQGRSLPKSSATKSNTLAYYATACIMLQKFYGIGPRLFYYSDIAACLRGPGVNFTNILRAAFAPKSFRPKIRNTNCKHIKAAQRTLVWLSISPIFYKQLFHTKVLCTALMYLQFVFLIFGQKDFGAKAAHKMLVKLAPGANVIKQYRGKLPW